MRNQNHFLVNETNIYIERINNKTAPYFGHSDNCHAHYLIGFILYLNTQLNFIGKAGN